MKLDDLDDETLERVEELELKEWDAFEDYIAEEQKFKPTEVWELRNILLEYYETTHSYYADGIKIPSVTQLMRVKFGNKYSGISKSTLENAANRGTGIHKAIENYCRYFDTNAEEYVRELRNFRFLEKNYKFIVQGNELPILICDEKTNKPICAGRLDLLFDIDDTHALADIKTTSTLDKEYLTYQLNLYRIGFMQCYAAPDITRLYGVHIRADKRKLVSVPINEEAAWDIIKKYQEQEGGESE